MRSKRFLAIALIIAMLLFSLQAAFGEDVSLEAATEIVNAAEDELDAVVGDEETVEIEEGDILPEEDGGEIESVPVDSEEISIESGDELIVEDEEELPGAEEAAAEELDGADLLAVLEDGDELLEIQEDGGDSEETVELPDVAEYSGDELATIQGVNIYIQDSTAEEIYDDDLNRVGFEVFEGETLQLFADPVLAEGAETTNVYSFVWGSADESIASVSTTGVVTARDVDATKDVLITATAYLDTGDPDNPKETGVVGQVVIRVKPYTDGIVLEKDGEAVGDTLEITNGNSDEPIELVYSCVPGDSLQVVKAVSADESILEVRNEDGYISLTPKANGMTRLTVTSGDDKAVRNVAVYVSMTEAFVPAAINVAATQYVSLGKKISLGATVTPKGAGTLTYSYKSKKVDSKIATIDKAGKVKGVKAGTANFVVTFTPTPGSKYAKLTKAVKVIVLPKPITKVAVSSATGSKVVFIDETLQLKAAVTPSTKYTVKAVKWTSSNANIATVNGSGLVTGKAPGTVTITCAATDGSGKKGAIKLKVGNRISGVKITGSDAVAIGKTIALKAGNTSDESFVSDGFTFAIAKKQLPYATVSAKGVVKGIKAKSITVVVTEKTTGLSAKKVIAVMKPIKSVALDKAKLDFDWDAIQNGTPAEPQTLTVQTIKPADAYQNKLAFVWASSNPKVAAVSYDAETGIATVTPVGGGVASITATATDGSGVKGTCTVTVARAGTSLEILNKNSGEQGNALNVIVGVGGKATLSPVFTPADTANKAVTWAISNKKIATVKNGVVTGVKAGSAVLTVKSSKYPELTATVNITVKPITTSIKLTSNVNPPFLKPVPADDSGIANNEGATAESLTLTAKVNKGASTNLKWTASPANVVKLTPSGNKCTVEAIPGGTVGAVKITAAPTDGANVKKLRKTVTVYVRNQVTSIALKAKSTDGVLYVVKGMTSPVGAVTAALTGKYEGEPSVTKITWTVVNSNGAADKTYAKVNTKGQVKGVKAGRTYLMATATDGFGTKSNKLKVVVVDKASMKVVVKAPKGFLYEGEQETLEATVTNKGKTSPVGVVWSTDKEDIVELTPSADGKHCNVEALAVGKVTITATAADGSGAKNTKKVEIEVGKSALSLEIFGLHAVATGATTPLTAVVYDAAIDEEEKNVIERSPVTWASSDDAIATVDASGVVTGKAEGQVTITATATASGEDPLPTAEFVVEVTGKAETVGIYWDEEDVTGKTIDILNTVDPIQLIARVEPDKANATVTWKLTTNTNNVASVNANGILTFDPNKAGKVVVTATTADNGGATAQVTFNVAKAVTGIAVAKVNANWTPHSAQKLQLKATVTPADAMQAVTWTSSNPNAAIDETGTVTLSGSSSDFTDPVTFTATATDGTEITGTLEIDFTSAFQWALDGNTAKITGYTGTDSAVTIPKYVNGEAITVIGDDAFMDNGAITSVAIPNNITTIGARAFMNCSNLASMEPY